MNNARTSEIISKIQSLLKELQQIVDQPQAVLTALAEDLSGFESLRKALQSDRWPEAVNPMLICDPNSEKDKVERGRGIVELMIEEDLNGLKFLDFGCGEGHCVNMSSEQNTIISVGYDIKQYESWERLKENKENLLFTTNIDEVASKGPYDVIILFDVIDHLASEEKPITVLSKARSLLSDKGKVYMRCHPFTSRHATHLYHTLNKAYVHLVFNPGELKEIIPDCPYVEPSIGVTTPIKTYQDFIEKAGLKIDSRRDITEKVEPFFKIPVIAERIMRNTKSNQFPEFQMSVQFIDYVLKKK